MTPMGSTTAPNTTVSTDELVKKLRDLSYRAKGTPWHAGGTKRKDGKTMYLVGPIEEELIITMRNNIDWILDLITSRKGE